MESRDTCLISRNGFSHATIRKRKSRAGYLLLEPICEEQKHYNNMDDFVHNLQIKIREARRRPENIWEQL